MDEEGRRMVNRRRVRCVDQRLDFRQVPLAAGQAELEHRVATMRVAFKGGRRSSGRNVVRRRREGAVEKVEGVTLPPAVRG